MMQSPTNLKCTIAQLFFWLLTSVNESRFLAISSIGFELLPKSCIFTVISHSDVFAPRKVPSIGVSNSAIINGIDYQGVVSGNVLSVSEIIESCQILQLLEMSDLSGSLTLFGFYMREYA